LPFTLKIVQTPPHPRVRTGRAAGYTHLSRLADKRFGAARAWQDKADIA
jgi:hypothetical protein